MAILYVDSVIDYDAVKSIIAVTSAKLDVDVVFTRPDRDPSNPYLPRLKLSDSLNIFGGNAIVKHLLGEGSADEWSDIEITYIHAIVPWIASLGKQGTWTQEQIAAAQASGQTFFSLVDKTIGGSNTRVATSAIHEISAVDCILWGSLFPLLGSAEYTGFESVDLSGFKNVSRWHKALGELPLVKQALARLKPLTALHTLPCLSGVPRLPLPNRRNILVTSALPYVNNVPHLGNIVGCVLSADVYSRYAKSRGNNVVYICGTDEYGTATETKALQEKMTPREICDKFNAVHKTIYEWFECGFDQLGRTSTPAQTEICQEIFWKLQNSGVITKDSIEQLFCEGCDRFLADRFVEGTCPNCKYEDARGDQCDKCGKLLNSIELVNPRCKLCSKPPKVKSTDHLFLELPKIKTKLEEWIARTSVEGNWDGNAIAIANSWVKEDKLKPRCITRDLKWGVPVPLEGFTNKVFYVWYDAPIGYISITANYTDQWKKWWQNPENVQLYQFMGKDNVAFHTIIFPSCLLGTGENWTLLHHISSTEYLNYESGKFSKSRNTGVFGDDAKASGIPVEVWRYYLISNRPESADTNFTWEDLANKNNSELLANFGNLAHRTLHFCHTFFQGVVPRAVLNEEDQEFFAQVNDALAKFTNKMDACALREGIYLFMDISHLGNGYFQKNKPWALKNEDVARCQTVVAVCVNLVYLLACCCSPFMPSVTEKLSTYLRLDASRIPDRFTLAVPAGHQIGVSQPIFSKLEDDRIKLLRSKFGGDEAATFPLDIRVGKIASVNVHPQADRLYHLQIDVGEGKTRSIVSGLREHYAPEQLANRQVLVLCNLPPADFKGVASEGMVLCAERGKKLGLLGAAGAPVGAQVSALEANTKPTPGLDIKEFKKMELKLKGAVGQGAFKHHLLFVGDVPVTADKDKGLTEGAAIK